MIENILPLNYQKNEHVRFEFSLNSTNYSFQYYLKDYYNQSQVFSLSYPIKTLQEMSQRFGYPTKYMASKQFQASSQEDLEAQIHTWENEKKQALKDGMFSVLNHVLRPDYHTIVSYYSEIFCLPIAEEIVKILKTENRDSRKERIELAMKFVQDIPYGIPDYEDDNGIYYAGLLSPAQVLFFRYGDCDSKALLFAGILTALIPAEDIAFLEMPYHFLTAIKEDKSVIEKTKKIQFQYRQENPVLPTPYFSTIDLNGDRYILAETAGPARLNYGETLSQYHRLKPNPLIYTGANTPLPL